LHIHAFVNLPFSSFFVASNNKIRMMENEGVDVTKAIGLAAGVTAKVHVADLFSLV
jgi:hypothetical protein